MIMLIEFGGVRKEINLYPLYNNECAFCIGLVEDGKVEAIGEGIVETQVKVKLGDGSHVSLGQGP